MNVVLRIDYISNENHVTQQGAFPLRRRSNEQAAYDFWREIKRSMRYECTIERVIADGEDITEKVKEIEKAPLD